MLLFKRVLRGALLGVLMATGLPGCAQVNLREPLPAEVVAALRRAQVPADAMAALVVPVDGGGVRLRHQSDRELNPASVMKLVTSYAAIDLLGPDHVWTTRFATDGVIENGALRGNLYIRGGGDPKFVLERIQAAYQTLQAMGIQVILGDMVLDHSAFEVPPVDPAAFDGEPLRPYNAAPDALLVNFKSVILRFTPDPATGVARVASEPPLAGLSIPDSVPLAGGPCGDWRAGLRARFDDPARIAFEGAYPRRCGELQWPLAYHDPGSYAARALEGLWRASGGLLTGGVRSGLMPPGATVLLDMPSLALADILVDVNQWSNNVMAQQVFLTLGQLAPLAPPLPGAPAAAPPAPPRSSFVQARAVLAGWWQKTFGPRVIAPVVENGSGLSRTERITPESLALLLRHAARHAQAGAFVQSLSVAGVNGTARNYARTPDSAVAGNAWLKTGTLSDVSSVAGYVNASNGTRYVVVAMVNHPDAPRARPAIEALLEWVARLPD